MKRIRYIIIAIVILVLAVIISVMLLLNSTALSYYWTDDQADALYDALCDVPVVDTNIDDDNSSMVIGDVISATNVEPDVSKDIGTVYEDNGDIFEPESIKRFFTDTLPWDVEVVFEERRDFDTGVQLVYSAVNTDAIIIFDYDPAMLVEERQPYGNPVNKYGSDYSVVYFENGVPSNSMDIYDAMFNSGITVDYYTTDYVSGSTVNLTRCSDNELFTVNLN